MNITSIQNVFAGLISLPIFSFHVQAVPAIVQQWIAAHPGQTALLVVDGVIVFTPAALTAPLLATMGFGASGPVAGTVAAWLQGIIGNIGAGGAFAALQSAAMGGYGVGVVNGVAQGCAAVSGAVVAWLGLKQ